MESQCASEFKSNMAYSIHGFLVLERTPQGGGGGLSKMQTKADKGRVQK